MTRFQSIMAAGALTSIVLGGIIAMDLWNFSQASASASRAAVAPASQQQASLNVNPGTQATIQEYQSQLEQANHTILQLQTERDWLAQQLAAAQATGGERNRGFVEQDNE
jgi:hypothetical protein